MSLGLFDKMRAYRAAGRRSQEDQGNEKDGEAGGSAVLDTVLPSARLSFDLDTAVADPLGDWDCGGTGVKAGAVAEEDPLSGCSPSLPSIRVTEEE